MKIKYILLALASSGALASAVTINIDFGRNADPLYTGVGQAPDTGTTWNAIDQSALTDAALVDSIGAASNITISKDVSNSFGTTGGGAPSSDTLMQDYLHDGNSGTIYSVTFSNLVAGGDYDLYLYGHGDQPVQHTEFIVDAANGGASGSNTASARVQTDVVVLNATADASGDITYTWGRPSGGAANHSAHNGVQLVAIVPEPSSGLLLGFSGLMFALRRRR